MDQEYKFWETDLERAQRLKRVWIDMKRKNALGGVDEVSHEDHLEVNEQIVSLLRKVRWKVDQEMTRRNIEPIFKENYADKYEKEEFLIDADMEFYKVKKLLDKNPRVLREDPILSIDYHKIITLLKQKKLVENTSDHFDPANAYKTTWHDAKDASRERSLEEAEAFKKH